MKEKTKMQKPAGYVPFPQKLNYSVASGGGNIITTIVGSFVSAYLTDSVGIAAAAVATMMSDQPHIRPVYGFLYGGGC